MRVCVCVLLLMNSLKMLFEISFHCKSLLTRGAELKWPSVVVNCLVLGESRLNRKCFTTNRSFVSHWYASVHRFLVSLEVSFLPKGFGTDGALVGWSDAGVHHLLVSLQSTFPCKCSRASRTLMNLIAGVHDLMLLQIRLPRKCLQANRTLVSLIAGVQHLMLVETT